MKKRKIMMSLMVASVALLSSCKKEYTCDCTVVSTITETDYYEDNGQQVTEETTYPSTTSGKTVTTDKVKKGDAESACVAEGGTTSSEVNGTVTSGGFKEGVVVKTTYASTCKLQ